MSQWIGSPNYTAGRQGARVDRIVLHWIVGTLASADSVFQNRQRGTSAHYGIENDTVHQYVRESDTAYHSGSWPFNLRSIGIEHSAAPDRPASEATYRTAARLVAELCIRHRIPCDRAHVVKHNQIVATQCPGTLNVERIVAEAARITRGETPVTGDEMYQGHGDKPLDVKTIAREFAKSHIYRITGNWHSTEDVDKNHTGKHYAELDRDFIQRNPAEYRNSMDNLLTQAFPKMTADQRTAKVEELRKKGVRYMDYANQLAREGKVDVADIATVEQNFINRLLAKFGEFLAGLKSKN